MGLLKLTSALVLVRVAHAESVDVVSGEECIFLQKMRDVDDVFGDATGHGALEANLRLV